MFRNRYKTSIAALAAAALLAACGQGVEEQGSGSSDKRGSGEALSGEAAAAQRLVDEYLKEPTTIPLETPLDAPAEPGGTIVWMKCETAQCAVIGEGVEEAAKAADWNYKEVNYKVADPATLVSGLLDALRLDPSAVAFSGLPRAVWESAAAAYEKADVPMIVGLLGGDNVQAPVIGEVAGDPTIRAYAEMLSQWFIADSNATGKAVLQSVNDFPILKAFSDTFKSTVKANCSKCEVTEVNATIAQVVGGQTVPSLISAIQSDPDINYLMTSNVPFISGIQGQLSAAGLTDRVKIAGESADTEGLQLLEKGTYDASTGAALRYTGWLYVDYALRHQQGMEMPAADGEGLLPRQLLTPDVKFEISDSYDKPTDFREQFKALWNLQ